MNVTDSAFGVPGDAKSVPLEKVGMTIQDLPVKLMKRILKESILTDYDLVCCKQVCRAWNKITDEFLPLIHTIKVFGKKAWETHFVEYKIEGEIPSPPSNILEITQSFCSCLRKDGKPLFCSLLLIPKGLTLNKLKKLSKMSEERPKFDTWLSGDIFQKCGDQSEDSSYWVLVTNDVIEYSKNRCLENQKELVAKTEPKGQLPKMLEVAVCCFMNYMSSGTYLFGRDPATFTRCREKFLDSQLCLGFFGKEGLNFCNNNFHPDVGAAISLTFEE